jgi:Mrp family chromosome partitioning ATPase
VVDTAPTILVTDTLLISKLADLTVYITRADHTDKKLITYSRDLKAQGKLNNMAYVVNNVGGEKGGYGYSYGYGYGYNYGYGYGYGDEDDVEIKKPKKSNLFSRLKR